ncbi:MAG TPA: ArsA family ATPase [Bacillota bacterium]|nr:ArsA family ATPase [Bacillota bacterium]
MGQGKKYIFFGGKGGVGKTTCSAAFSKCCAKTGDRTLVVSTDPAHSLADIFGVSVGPEIELLEENLYGLEIDSEIERNKYSERIKAQLTAGISPVIIEEIQRQIDAANISPGAEEAAIFDKFIEIIKEKGNEFDRIIFDTAPTGHTLRLLSLPELMGGWMDNLISKRKSALSLMSMIHSGEKAKQEIIDRDPILSILQKRKAKFEQAREILIDSDTMEFIFVINPEKLPILETKKAIEILMKYRIPVGGVIVNRTIPEEYSKGNEFWSKRKTLELQYMDMINKEFPGRVLTILPLLEEDIKGDNLDTVSEHFIKVKAKMLGEKLK